MKIFNNWLKIAFLSIFLLIFSQPLSALEIGLSIADATFTEGDSGTTNMAFTVSSSASAPTGGISFSYSLSHGTTSSSDLDLTGGSGTIAADSKSATITIPIKGDLIQESTETFTVTISSTTPLYDSTAIGTISDNDTRSIAIGNATVTEGSNAVLTVALTGNTASVPLTFNYTTGGGTATAGSDYTAYTNQSASIPAGATSTTISIPTVNDTLVESTETFNVTLSNTAGTTGITTATGTVTLNDNDKYILTLSPATWSTPESNSGTTPATYTVTVNQAIPTGQTITVNYSVGGGTATSGTDYTATSGTLTFNPGDTSKTFDVPIKGDTTPEQDETYIVTLSNPSANAQLGTSSATGTITNDDSGTLTISQSGTTISEGGGSKTYTVTLSPAPTSAVSVIVSTSNGSATGGGVDFSSTSQTLNFAIGVTTKTYTVSIVDDAIQENDETFTVNLSSPVNATIGTGSVMTTITDNDGRTLSISPTTRNTPEGNSGSTPVTYTVTLSGTPLNNVSVNYATANGTATAGSDYTAATGILNFAAGASGSALSQTFTVSIQGDTTPEPNENYTVTLSGATGATIATATATETITNDDTPTLSFANLAPSITEANTNLAFTVNLSAAQSTNVTVQYATANGTAVAPGDYTASGTQTLTFLPNETSKTINVAIKSDTINEADETFTLKLTSPVGATISGGDTATGTIIDNDALTLSLSAPAPTPEGNSGTTNMPFTVKLNKTPSSTVTVNYATANGTATIANNDYQDTHNTLTFAAGTTTLTQTINVPIVGDTTLEPDETYTLTLSSPVNATISGSATATGTILNDDTSISINDVTIQEGPCNTVTANLTVTLAQAVNYAVTVGYSTGGGTATSGSDYVAASGSITIPAGFTTGTIGITINPDTLVESPETFNVTITNAAGITITDNVGVVTITDNQNRDVTAFNDVSTTEGDIGTKPLTFTVALCQAASNNITLNYATSNTGANPATEGTDYVSGDGGTVTIPAGSTSATFAIQIIGDLMNEPNETFLVTLSGAPVGVTITDTTAIGTITNDDTRTISINDVTVTEGSTVGSTTNATLRITLSAAAAADITVNYTTKNGTATTADSDYQSASGSWTFPANTTTLYKDITFLVNQDTKVEANEYFDVNISTPNGVTISDNSGRVTINDDDNRTLTLGGTNTYSEGDVNRDINLTVTLNSVSPVDRTLKYSTVNGTATAGSDFIGVTNQSVTIPANTTSVNLPITLIGDLVYEPNETFNVTITSDDGFALSGSPRTVTINNDDGRLSINSPLALSEGDVGQKDLNLTITLSQAMGTAVDVNYSTGGGTAIAGTDYIATSGGVTFAPGQTSKTVTVKVIGDTVYETPQDETFNVTITSPSGVTILTSPGVGTIRDDDARTISITSPSFNETEGNVSRDFNISMSASMLNDLNLTFATANGTATTADNDYVSKSGTITIPAGSTSILLPVTVVGDYKNESNENFTLSLATSTPGITLPSPGTMTILNDDGILNINATVSKSEGNTSTSNMPFTVTLSQAMGSTVNVPYTTRDGNATLANNDYQDTNGMLVFSPGQTSKTINVPIIGDIVFEGNEYFELNISNTQGVTITNSNGIGTILEDDARLISVVSQHVGEGDIGQFTTDINITLAMVSGNDANISYTVSSTTATNGVDFNASSGYVMIPAGTLSTTIPITHYGDLTYEPNEDINITITTTSPGFSVSGGGVLTLDNDDGVLRMGGLTILEGNTSTTTSGLIRLNLTRSSTLPIDVNYTMIPVTATANVDYVSESGQVTIPAESTYVDINITILGDAEIEGDETFKVRITNEQNVTVDIQDGIVTIDDDDVDAMEIFDHQKPFGLRFGKNIYGNYVSTGAPIMCALDDTNTSCDWSRTGSLASSVTRFLNDAGMSKNSSSADLNITMEPGDQVLWAGLYWQGHIEANVADYLDNNTSGWNTIKFKTPLQTYTKTASLTDINQTSYYAFQAATSAENDGFRFFYQGYADVTSEVNASLTSNPGRTFSVGEMTATTGADHIINDPALNNGLEAGRVGHFGGWSLIVVYEKGDKSNPDDLRNVSIFDGYKYLVAGTANPTQYIDINVNGFRTPSSLADGEDIDSTLLYFGGGSEKTMTGDEMRISNKSGEKRKITDAKNPSNNPFNDTISRLGEDVNPVRIFNPGIDLDTIQVSRCLDDGDVSQSCLDTNQSSTTIRLSAVYGPSGSDQAFVGAIGFSTQLYQPQLCYDFSYQQNGSYLKKTVSERDIPTIEGTVIANDEITAAIYLKNIDSDFAIKGLSLFTDMNGSKIGYIHDTTKISRVNGVTYPASSTSEEDGGACSYSGSSSDQACRFATTEDTAKDNLRVGIGSGATGYSKSTAGELGSGEYIYTQFKLNPFALSGDVNESLGLKIDYFIDLDNGDGEIQVQYTLGKHLKLCPASSVYMPTWGRFNVVENNASNNLGSYYNLSTQASKKPFNVDVAFYESNGGLYNVPGEVNTTVIAEIIDVDAFHDINASCANPESSKSPPVFVRLQTTTSDNTQLIPIQTPNDYNFAVKNAAYRIWWFDSGDANHTVLAQNWTASTNDGSYQKVQNITSISGLFDNAKHVLCSGACNGQETTPSCFACMKENYTHPICSRDNFSIRPESFDIRIRDVNQTTRANLANVSEIYHYIPGASTPSSKMPLTAGYVYSYDVNATSNLDINGVPGYTRYFKGASTEYNASMVWDSTKTGCNDISGQTLTFDVKNGVMVDGNSSKSQVGEYYVQMIDTTWTAVDWRDTSHHSGSGWLNGYDCLANSDDVPIDTSASKVGCNISSSHTTNGGVVYRNPQFELHPNRFDLSTITYGKGVDNAALDTTSGANNFLYMADIEDTDQSAMALKVNGQIAAVDYNGVKLSNFVSQCYAKDLNLSLVRTSIPDQNISAYLARLVDSNGTNVLYDTNATVIATNQSTWFVLGEGNFTKSAGGDTNISMSMNYDRNISRPMNPVRMLFDETKVTCSDATVCQQQYDGSLSDVEGNKTMNFGVTHYYGRAQGVAGRIKTDGPSDNTAEGYVRVNFEIFCGNDGNITCNKTLLPLGANTPQGEDRDWFRNRDHVVANGGTADTDGNLTRKSGSGSVTVSKTTSVTGSGITIGGAEVGFERFGATYNGDRGYPHTVILQNIPNEWLLYHPTNSLSTFNEFGIEFYKPSNVVGQDKANTNMDTDASVVPSRRIMW